MAKGEKPATIYSSFLTAHPHPDMSTMSLGCGRSGRSGHLDFGYRIGRGKRKGKDSWRSRGLDLYKQSTEYIRYVLVLHTIAYHTVEACGGRKKPYQRPRSAIQTITRRVLVRQLTDISSMFSSFLLDSIYAVLVTMIERYLGRWIDQRREINMCICIYTCVYLYIPSR
jgi:hypothetical protein